MTEVGAVRRARTPGAGGGGRASRRRRGADARDGEGGRGARPPVALDGHVHGTLKLLRAAAAQLDRKADEIATSAGTPAFLHQSIKRGLDVDWTDPHQKADAVAGLIAQIDALETWIRDHVGNAADEPPLRGLFALIAQLRAQDLEPDPSGGGPRIRKGVAEDRRVSVEDADMRPRAKGGCLAKETSASICARAPSPARQVRRRGSTSTRS